MIYYRKTLFGRGPKLTAVQLSASNIETLMRRLQGFFGTGVALTTTAITIYTGLKGIIGG